MPEKPPVLTCILPKITTKTKPVCKKKLGNLTGYMLTTPHINDTVIETSGTCTVNFDHIHVLFGFLSTYNLVKMHATFFKYFLLKSNHLNFSRDL